MIRALAITAVDALLAADGRHVRRRRAKQLAIESAFTPSTCERLLEVCDDRVGLARLAIHVAMLTREDPVVVILDAKDAAESGWP